MMLIWIDLIMLDLYIITLMFQLVDIRFCICNLGDWLWTNNRLSVKDR